MIINSIGSTSPSIYAKFHSLSIEDQCGISVISSTMLSFSVGELSSIEGPLGIPGIEDQRKKRFNFRDLPCPPQSIMVKTRRHLQYFDS